MDISKTTFSAPLRAITSVALAGVLLLASGCGGSGGSSSSSSSSFPTPSLPAAAREITVANANATGTLAAGFATTLSLVNGFKSNDQPTLPQVFGQISDFVKSQALNRTAIAAQTEDVSADLCASGGSAVADFDETSTTEIGEIDFTSCNIGSGIVINGNLTYEATFNNNTGSYSIQFGGTLSISVAGETITIVLNATEQGNDNTGAFAGEISFSLDGITDGGFLVTTIQLWTGNSNTFVIDSGQLIVQGSNNTRLRITVTVPNMADIELDNGSVTFVNVGTISF